MKIRYQVRKPALTGDDWIVIQIKDGATQVVGYYKSRRKAEAARDKLKSDIVDQGDLGASAAVAASGAIQIVAAGIAVDQQGKAWKIVQVNGAWWGHGLYELPPAEFVTHDKGRNYLGPFNCFDYADWFIGTQYPRPNIRHGR